MEIKKIRDWLRDLAEDEKSEMSVNVYNYIWNMIQCIDRELEGGKLTK